jgi:hypothetical protein
MTEEYEVNGGSGILRNTDRSDCYIFEYVGGREERV